MGKAEKKARKEFYAGVDKIRDKFKGMKPDEIDNLVNEAIRWARKQSKSKQPKKKTMQTLSVPTKRPTVA